MSLTQAVHPQWLDVNALTDVQLERIVLAVRDPVKPDNVRSEVHALLKRFGFPQGPWGPPAASPHEVRAALDIDTIKRRLAVYAVSIDGFDSLNAAQQELLTDCATWAYEHFVHPNGPLRRTDETCA